MTATSARPAELTGRVVHPGDAEYPTARLSWNLRFSHEPAVIVFARETHDVVNALAWAREHAMPVRVRSGGHCLEGWSTVDDGIVIDVSEMKSATIDANAHTATVGAGLKQLEAVTALGEAGFAAPTGTEGTVGLVGATLGGGFGLLTRNFGMASDNLLAAEIVIAAKDGAVQVLTVDETNHADLLWALRGAGNGNFGIVTSLTYRVRPLTQAIYVTATWPGLDTLADVFEAWQRSAPHTDDRLTSQLEIRRDEVQLIGALAPGSEAEAKEMLASILSVGAPTVTIVDGTWADIYAGFQIPTPDEPQNWMFKSQFIYQPYPVEAIEVVRTFMAKAPTPECNYFTNAFGGAVAGSEPSGGSVFAHRDALFYAEPGAGWGIRGAGIPASEDPLTVPLQEWIEEFAAALAPHVDGAYVNVPNAGMPGWESAYWGAGVDRLRTIKAKYDPDDVFTFEQSIQPAVPRPQ
ncbi:putative FAD-linked oxidoreductase YgaK [Mycobacterium antarcticum]|uniref:FAD-binding oxidoreductase n=1 Tax=unclassified Mycolicibacterium TaxID=2636767 RepID=UPI002390CFFC|nr:MULTISPECIES: FAD-binding oxidoreductase [unclassified Mycolicibacterium]BDX33745.1 putative FAD-linked oxidoreductase YgaK [Mycolicibacterium sp. TUM20985]GLP76913.1 putative FAD-linked oxidoreductase YgaK [Mycolicibacterium sp. TUM20983]GLP82666.1 putative FAD-linked oxidoreductase YgaK [Mycolicibacterium sp. TUM20984]